MDKKYILKFAEISAKDTLLVGGKNASLGEMYRELTPKGVNVPNGFALTSDAYWYYLKANKIDGEIAKIFNEFNRLSADAKRKNLNEVSKKTRQLILDADFPADLKQEILEHYRWLSAQYREKNTKIAARSSATAEDSATASFAGQHETYLNVSGEKEVLSAIKKCISSLFLARAISYREEKGFDHLKIALSVGVQKMIRSDQSSSGIMFTLDTESGFRDVVMINGIWGVGEMIVKGLITPDQFYVFKPTLKQGFRPVIVKNLGRKTKKYIFSSIGLKEAPVSASDQGKLCISEDEVLKLAKWACLVEEHYGRPQDLEWAKDGKNGDLFITQSRPETVESNKSGNVYEEYEVETTKDPLISGIAVGNKIGQGKARIITDISKISQFKEGEVLVAKMTDPDWMPVMRIASAIVTDEGSRVCHAAIVSRELGIPCVVGTKDGTKAIKSGQVVTVDCTQGMAGRIFSGKVPFAVKRYNLSEIPKLKAKVMVNVGIPDTAFKASFIPNDGVGLAREEFIITEKIKVHPLALYHFDKLKDKALKNKIQEVTLEHKDKKEFFVKELAEGIGQIAAAFYPKEVIVRFSDFKSNEYKNLIGGSLFERDEENPMLGFRGASRYLDKTFQPAFLMECEAMRRVREVFGLKNISMMVPFCRTVEEGEGVLKLMAESGLDINLNDPSADDLKVYVMCEIPSNVLLAEKFLKIFDGMSIGSNDLTQLILGLDRDSRIVASVGDERNEAVKQMIKTVISECRRLNKYVGICGEAPSTYPEFAEFLINEGISSISLNPNSVIKTIITIADKNKEVMN